MRNGFPGEEAMGNSTPLGWECFFWKCFSLQVPMTWCDPFVEFPWAISVTSYIPVCSLHFHKMSLKKNCPHNFFAWIPSFCEFSPIGTGCITVDPLLDVVFLLVLSILFSNTLVVATVWNQKGQRVQIDCENQAWKLHWRAASITNLPAGLGICLYKISPHSQSSEKFVFPGLLDKCEYLILLPFDTDPP